MFALSAAFVIVKIFLDALELMFLEYCMPDDDSEVKIIILLKRWFCLPHIKENYMFTCSNILERFWCCLIYFQNELLLKRKPSYFNLLIRVEGLNDKVLDEFFQFVKSASKKMNLKVKKRCVPLNFSSIN